MPTYDYVCDACDHQFELFQSIKAEPEKKCPKCGKKKLRRLIGAGAALLFKGSGFYTTDYRSASYKDKAKSESGGASGGKSEGSANGTAKEGSKGKDSGSSSKNSSPKE